ncbi:hypothetical protein BDV98DRAFT_344290 [Pterulicium gracile]|uniref:F-box domain-containing protein n=1 Tax=Pterulicium gracile TaxID=1884261 RepID=A0A5C3Q6F1_9AGAR|nr:hypothetical protein BDV98DRAFT_344290 [Pterula gracilis]
MDNFHKPTYVDLLPLELLLSILAHIPTCQNILNTSSPAWALSQTSSILRSACLASPNLWSTITVDPPAAYPISQIRYLLPLALQRSQPLGVKIRLINQEGRLNSAFRVALDILLEHSSRWADVEFVNLEEPALGLSLPGTLGFSSMKSLAFSTHHPSLVARHLLYGLLHGSRDLDSLGLYLEFRSPPFFELITSMEIGRWQRLLELRLRIPSDWRIPELLTVLTLTSNVRRFSVSDYGVRRSELIDGLPILPPGLWLPGLTVQPLNGTENGSGAGHILLEHLSNLEIYAKSVWTFTAVLSNISVPNLDSLSLYLPRQVNAIDLLDPLAQLLRHSGLNNQSGGLGTKGIRRLHLSSARAFTNSAKGRKYSTC